MLKSTDSANMADESPFEISKVCKDEVETPEGAKKGTGCYEISFGGGGAAASGGGKVTLRERFEKFREEKRKALELERERAKQRTRTSTEAEREALRQKFIDTAMKYIGVPYRQGEWEPGTPEFESPIFLDWFVIKWYEWELKPPKNIVFRSCGLVRKAMRDLQDEFGFRLGRWNQAYQFDTLYDAQVPFEEAKPGDLVFYSGRYVNEKKRRFKFDMVHVEIFLGGGETGERTLGSRWRTGKVSIFDSYKFESKNWKDVTYYFCSIEPWLRGECQPKVNEWTTRSLEWCANKRSLFSLDTQDEDFEEPAEDD